jgi:hypothetical protein
MSSDTVTQDGGDDDKPYRWYSSHDSGQSVSVVCLCIISLVIYTPVNKIPPGIPLVCKVINLYLVSIICWNRRKLSLVYIMTNYMRQWEQSLTVIISQWVNFSRTERSASNTSQLLMGQWPSDYIMAGNYPPLPFSRSRHVCHFCPSVFYKIL